MDLRTVIMKIGSYVIKRKTSSCVCERRYTILITVDLEFLAAIEISIRVRDESEGGTERY